MAERPTDFIVMAANANGIMPPTIRKAKVNGFSIFTPSLKRLSFEARRIQVTKAPKRDESGRADSESLPDGSSGIGDCFKNISFLTDGRV